MSGHDQRSRGQLVAGKCHPERASESRPRGNLDQANESTFADEAASGELNATPAVGEIDPQADPEQEQRTRIVASDQPLVGELVTTEDVQRTLREMPDPQSPEATQMDRSQFASGPIECSDVKQAKLFALISEVNRTLTEADDVPDVLLYCGAAESISAVARNANASQEVLMEAACARVRTEHHLGVKLREQDLAAAAPGNQYTGELERPEGSIGRSTLKDLGIHKNRSSRAQWLARLTVDELEQWLEDRCRMEKLPSINAATNEATARYGKKKKPSRRKPKLESDSAELPGMREQLQSATTIRHYAHEILNLLEPKFKPGGGVSTITSCEISALRNFVAAIDNEVQQYRQAARRDK